MKIPNYPSDFYNFGEGYKTPEKDINHWIKQCIEELEENPDLAYKGTASGDTIVQVSRLDPSEGKYEVIVSKGYHRTTIY